LMALGVLSVASACFILLVRPYDLIFKLVSAEETHLHSLSETVSTLKESKRNFAICNEELHAK
jgi:hypothetical protein